MSDNRFGAVILAAGNSSRFGGEKSKILLEINKIPVIKRTVSVFDKCKLISGIVIVCREQDKKDIENSVKEYKNKIKIVTGGSTRQQSVKNGVYSILNNDFFVIHDGARPLVDVEVIEKVCFNALKYGASAAAVKVKDTLKFVDEDGFVKQTPQRDYLRAIQTPQVIEKELYLSSLKKAEDDGKDFTDDCQLVEYNNSRVYLTESNYKNIKVTTPEDIILVEAFLKQEED